MHILHHTAIRPLGPQAVVGEDPVGLLVQGDFVLQVLFDERVHHQASAPNAHSDSDFAFLFQVEGVAAGFVADAGFQVLGDAGSELVDVV